MCPHLKGPETTQNREANVLLRFSYMLDDDSHLKRRQDFLARLVAGRRKLGEELRLLHPTFELVAGRWRRIVREVKLGQLLKAVSSNREICHVLFCVVEGYRG